MSPCCACKETRSRTCKDLAPVNVHAWELWKSAGHDPPTRIRFRTSILQEKDEFSDSHLQYLGYYQDSDRFVGFEPLTGAVGERNYMQLPFSLSLLMRDLNHKIFYLAHEG